ncbi:uncharacterized protein SCHCODRAFT_02123576 [Schizophyllum commune H4-8]|uniref:uncharacterized protein n=1 Tax=Schizophyllum commune (strain H4-8 / FGSC 9210) TaxID=578458 RepID=UPI00215E48DA|nr:uncharacterized protein SCHCODRAFT_02123576 [Schizophyllum commune H4-8]KAI5885259.1 hypothetical protein SCHCODRAFT_02123576 [Schizophyllum commune H4-8]
MPSGRRAPRPSTPPESCAPSAARRASARDPARMGVWSACRCTARPPTLPRARLRDDRLTAVFIVRLSCELCAVVLLLPAETRTPCDQGGSGEVSTVVSSARPGLREVNNHRLSGGGGGWVYAWETMNRSGVAIDARRDRGGEGRSAMSAFSTC